MGRSIENASEGTTRQIDKEAESAGVLNTYVYQIMDAQLNIQNEAFVSAIYSKNADNERTSYGTVCSSNTSKKTHLALDLLEREYFNHFNFIIIICTTLRYNETYCQRKWFWTDPYIFKIEPGNLLYY